MKLQQLSESPERKLQQQSEYQRAYQISEQHQSPRNELRRLQQRKETYQRQIDSNRDLLLVTSCYLPTSMSWEHFLRTECMLYLIGVLWTDSLLIPVYCVCTFIYTFYSDSENHAYIVCLYN